MSMPLQKPFDVERFRDIVARRLGLQFEDAKLGWLGDAMQGRMESLQLTGEDYLQLIDADAEVAGGEHGALAQELTVGETYFFRNIDQFRALKEQAWPERVRSQRARRGLRILSAGCASGEEAYSIAMTLQGQLPDPSWQLAIHAIDINPSMIAKARRARYADWSLRETPTAMRERWFRREGREHALDDAITGCVTFEVRNLCEEDTEFWRPEAYDIIFCRNMLMYLTPHGARAAMARLTRSLAPRGFLFLGHAETLRGLSSDFELLHTHDTFYYQLKGAESRAETSAQAQTPRSTRARGLRPGPIEVGGDSWMAVIDKAAGRIRHLTSQISVPLDTGKASGSVPWQLGPVLELLQQERYAQALDLVQVLPAEAERDPDVLLLQAVLLTQHSKFDRAGEVCQRLLSIDGLNAGAHYVLALCREAAGDDAGAAERDQVAVYLDPAFAMPRLHLGLMARRAGNRDAVHRELSLALALLQREDASRLMLFGGGFNRDALLTLCRAELQACARLS